MKLFVAILAHAIFWVWNLSFITIVYTGILPIIGPELIRATFAGEIPSEFLFTFVCLLGVPSVCTLLGFRFIHQPLKLVRLFYGVEAPLFLLCLLRLFVIRELTPASGQIVGTILLCIAAFALELLMGYAGAQPNLPPLRRQVLSGLQLIGHSLMLLVGLYAGVLLLFYALPAGWALSKAFLSLDWLRSLWDLLRFNPWTLFGWGLLFFILFACSATLFVAMPLVLAALYIRSGGQILRAVAAQFGPVRTLALSVGVVALWAAAFLALQQQPQIQALALLAQPATTESSRQALLARSQQIRSGLLNAYLSSYRYLSSREDNNHIRELYRGTVGLPEPTAQRLQTVYNQLMSPFLYQGSREDRPRAAQLYAQFFDTSIQKAERAAVNHALRSTFNRDEVKAGLLNANQEKVWLAQQALTVQEHGDWAELELHEVYENQTPEVQEVFYSFSLPESAVITGLWLGESEDLAKRFAFVVSPRGAAQQVYNDQVVPERPVDPALLEQVGPRHYRLRAFPVFQKPRRMHLWLTYTVLRQADGWPLPALGEPRNVFWNLLTDRRRNGKRVAPQAGWLEASVPASGPLKPSPHQVNAPGGYRITAQPLAERDYSLPQGKRFALVLDSSRSMADQAQALNQTLRGLREPSLARNDFDVYVTTAAGAKPRRIDQLPDFDPAKLTFYGTIPLQDMLGQFAQLRGPTAYDAILLVTDAGSYELSQDGAQLPSLPAPLWLVHLGALPPAYDDAMSQAIQGSGGGVSTDVQEVLRRVTTQAALGPSVTSVVDGYAWTVTQSAEGADRPDRFFPLAARQLILSLSQQIQPGQLAQLDAIHRLAKTSGIVTPYSSMIVLVNEQQREALRRAESAKDRFEREVETGQEQLGEPPNLFNVSGVPEPHEWLLLGVASVALVVIARRQVGLR